MRELALLHGHEEVAEYLRANRRYQKVYDILPSASELGHLDILQAKRDRRGLDWGSALLNAVIMDRREIVQWLCTESPAKSSRIPLEEAIAHGDLTVLKYLYDNHIGRWTGATMTFAASSGRLEIVHWLHECLTDACSSDAMDQAASNGHLDVVEWLHSHRNEACTTDAMDDAAANGHLHVLQWLHANRTEGCTVRAMNQAARSGHLEVVA